MKEKKIRNILIAVASILIVCAVVIVLAVVLTKDDSTTSKHNLVLHPEVSATCTEDGVGEYWECEDCNKIFADKDGENEIQQPPVISALGHDFSEVTYACSRCNETNATEGLNLSSYSVDVLSFCVLDGVTGVPETLVLPYSHDGALLNEISEDAIPDGVVNIVIPACESLFFNRNSLPDSIENIYYLGDIATWSSDYEFTLFNGANWIGTTSHSLYLANEDKSDWVKVEQLQLNVQQISKGAFIGFDFTSIEMGEDVEIIGSSTFLSCASLTNLNLGATRSIGVSCFMGCASLADIQFSSNIETVNSSAFLGCNNIATILYDGTQEQWTGISWSVGNDSVKNFENITFQQA